MCALILAAALLAACAGTTSRGDEELVRMLAGTRCGVERWSIKTLTDPAAAQVNLTPKPATVEDLTALSVPAGFGPDAGRLAPELQTYMVAATLVEFKEEADSDFHLVIHGASGQSMIAEIPDPACMDGSPVRAQVAAARSGFVQRFGPASATKWTPANVPITITGVLFFDVIHGQTGVAPNGVEVHPIISVNL
jgi:hypothetical protein